MDLDLCQKYLLKIEDYFFNFSIEKFKIRLKRPFGTSHSTTTERDNCLFKIQSKINNKIINARGESGLPQKKSNCYLADFNDCLNYFQSFILCSRKDKFDKNTNYCEIVFQGLDQQHFKNFRNSIQIEDNIFAYLLYICDQAQGNNKEFRAGKSGLESCVFEALCIFRGVHFTDLLEIDTTQNKYAFYTVSLNEDINKMIEDAQYGLQFTKFLKIKLDGDIQKCEQILFALKNYGEKWSLDANSGWNEEISMKLLPVLQQYQQKIKMVEQPFPVDFRPNQNQDVDKQWKNILQQYNQAGLLIYADESISTFEDIDIFKEYVNGVNIKLEKAGGIRNAIIAIQKAKKENLEIWQGVMVASALNNSVAASLLYFGELGDMDGALLVEPDSYIGGFDWEQGLVKLIKTPGFGVEDVKKKN